MPAVTVTVGRNVADRPMDATAWRAYRRAVREVLRTADADMWVDGARYTGRWEGVREDAAVWHAALPADTVDAVRTALRSLAAAYRQDAVGFSVAESPELLTAA